MSDKMNNTPQGQNNMVSYKTEPLARSTDRVLSALYLITSLMDENETLRTKLRDTGIDISDSIRHLGESEIRTTKTIRHVRMSITKMVSLLSVARTVELLTPMNADIVTRAYLRIDTELARLTNVNFSDSYDLTFVPLVESVIADGTRKVDVPLVQKKDTERAEQKVGGVTGHISHKGHKKDIKKTHTNRADAIVQVIRQKGSVSIKDISQIITDCSEKTIQRELISLIANGVVSKTGERRWSMYALA